MPGHQQPNVSLTFKRKTFKYLHHISIENSYPFSTLLKRQWAWQWLNTIHYWQTSGPLCGWHLYIIIILQGCWPNYRSTTNLAALPIHIHTPSWLNTGTPKVWSYFLSSLQFRVLVPTTFHLSPMEVLRLIDCFTVSMHSPNGRQNPAVRAVQGDCQWPLKNVKNSQQSSEPKMHCDLPRNHCWCWLPPNLYSYQPILSCLSPTASPTAIMLRLCNSLRGLPENLIQLPRLFTTPPVFLQPATTHARYRYKWRNKNHLTCRLFWQGFTWYVLIMAR